MLSLTGYGREQDGSAYEPPEGILLKENFITVGRSYGSDVKLLNKFISCKHATLVRTDDDYEVEAKKRLTDDNYKGISRGAEDNITLVENRKAFKRYKIIPTLLKDVSTMDLSTSVLGHKISFPVCIAPSAAHMRAHPEGEVATAAGATDAGVIFALSSYASKSIEEVRAGNPNGLLFFQLYVFKRRDLVVELLNRAENSSYKAVVVTVDSPTTILRGTNRWDETRESFARQPSVVYKNLISKNEEGLSAAEKFDIAEDYLDDNVTWEDIKWLQTVTTLPIILKGILTAEDAVTAVEVGVAGIIVSNHGGRQLDTVPATIDVLGDIVRAVRGRCEVYMDGGVRTGTDVLKAIAMGAKAVFIGRPAIYALACDGRTGVKEMLELLKEELKAAMAMSGCANLEDVKKCIIRHKRDFRPKL